MIFLLKLHGASIISSFLLPIYQAAKPHLSPD